MNCDKNKSFINNFFSKNSIYKRKEKDYNTTIFYQICGFACVSHLFHLLK